jgi:agmatinase
VILGGDHAITIGAVEALAARHDRLTVLQLDAHADLRDSYQGSPWSHACVMRRVREICPAVSVGVRSYSELEAAHIRDQRLPVIGPGGIRESRGRFAEMLGALSESVYVTVDADVFDPAIMPATGTPEPGGLTWEEVDSILAWVCENRRVVGLDVVELMPIPGFVAPEYILARLIYRTIGRAVTAGGGPDARA